MYLKWKVYSHRMCNIIDCSALMWFTSPHPWFSSRILTMIPGMRLADIGYRTFSASMMLLTVYGGYLCTMRGYRYMQRQKEVKLAAENQDPKVLKEWPDRLLLFWHMGTFPIPAFVFIRWSLFLGCNISLRLFLHKEWVYKRFTENTDCIHGLKSILTV